MLGLPCQKSIAQTHGFFANGDLVAEHVDVIAVVRAERGAHVGIR
jgi:hypothetical protein